LIFTTGTCSFDGRLKQCMSEAVRLRRSRRRRKRNKKRKRKKNKCA
jgi:hypothetical protein